MSEENAPYNAGHDPTVTLRLELGRMTDKANAFEAALRKEVLAVIAQEVAKAKAADAEIAKLKAEVERLRASSFVTAVPVEEYEKLKAEVEMWKLRSDNWQKLCQIAKEGHPTQEYVGQYPNPVNLVPIKQAGDDKKGDAS